MRHLTPLRSLGVAGAVALLCAATAAEAQSPATVAPEVSAAGPSSGDGGERARPQEAGSEVSAGAAPRVKTRSVGDDGLFVYVPPTRSAPAVRVDGGTRSSFRDLPLLRVLAPEHVGVTRSAQPSLYWFVSAPVQGPLLLVIDEPDAIHPVFELELPGPFEPGIHAIHLSRHHFTLDAGQDYVWHVVLPGEESGIGGDMIAAGGIRHEPESVERHLEFAGLAPPASLLMRARTGDWYDALAGLSAQIEAEPGNPALRQQRAALAEQVGLSAVAAHDRDATSGRR